MHTQIIHLNDPSSSGKTTLAKALQEEPRIPFLRFGIDQVIDWMPEKTNLWEGDVIGFSWKKGQDHEGSTVYTLHEGPFAQQMKMTFLKIAVQLAELGHHFILDDILLTAAQHNEWRQALAPFKVLWVGVDLPLEILEERERQRGDRKIGSARAQFYQVHQGANYDLRVDTHKHTLPENIRHILQRI